MSLLHHNPLSYIIVLDISDTNNEVQFPETCYDWPTAGLRRASINSFGYGGANSHIVLDDAYNFMRLRGLQGRHRTRIITHNYVKPMLSNAVTQGATQPSQVIELPQINNMNKPPLFSSPSHKLSRSIENLEINPAVNGRPTLLVLSANDKGGINRIAGAYETYWSKKGLFNHDCSVFLNDLAHTLHNCRTHLSWRSFVVLQPPFKSNCLQQLSAPSMARNHGIRLGFVFTGQGAQWCSMGRELIRYTSFRKDLEIADSYMRRLGSTWSVYGMKPISIWALLFNVTWIYVFVRLDWLITVDFFADEMTKSEEQSKIDEPEISQTLCTVLQVALVNLLRNFGIHPDAVTGHSSGEIAAAYVISLLFTCFSRLSVALLYAFCEYLRLANKII